MERGLAGAWGPTTDTARERASQRSEPAPRTRGIPFDWRMERPGSRSVASRYLPSMFQPTNLSDDGHVRGRLRGLALPDLVRSEDSSRYTRRETNSLLLLCSETRPLNTNPTSQHNASQAQRTARRAPRRRRGPTTRHTDPRCTYACNLLVDHCICIYLVFFSISLRAHHTVYICRVLLASMAVSCARSEHRHAHS